MNSIEWFEHWTPLVWCGVRLVSERSLSVLHWFIDSPQDSSKDNATLLLYSSILTRYLIEGFQ